jgi:hypothetical protein
MSNLLELAERCEAATGPDRELDVELAVVAGLIRDPEFERGYFYGAGNNCDYVLERGDYDHGNNAPELPSYTASLDAAMMLVPEGHIVAVTNCDPDLPAPDFARASAIVALDPDSVVAPTVAKTMPLALCAAALRAINTAKEPPPCP